MRRQSGHLLQKNVGVVKWQKWYDPGAELMDDENWHKNADGEYFKNLLK